jgi:opacity protein-like surface antigen
MKKLILPLLVAGTFAAPSMAQAASNPYVSLSTGLSLMNDSAQNGASSYVTYKTGYLINGAVGLKNGDTRIEAEIGYHHNAVDKVAGLPYSGANLSMSTYMANAYYDIDMAKSSITPFVMGGLGLAHIKMDDNGNAPTDTKFAWQLGIGAGIKASKAVTIDLGYRYLKPSAPTFYGDKYTMGGSELLAGVRAGF